MKPHKTNISRKKFLNIAGSVVAGGVIAGVSGTLLHKIFAHNRTDAGTPTNPQQLSTSQYKLVSSFSVPENIEAFELADDELIVAASNTVFIYNQQGTLLNSFAVSSNLRDIATIDNRIYLLFATRIEAYDKSGKLLYGWEACSERSDYCAMAAVPNALFVTDVVNKNICKYTADGNFVKFINSPDGFIIPSYSFGITCANEAVYCSNSGRHRVEKYTLDGEYVASFGKAGGAAGMFCGCCNPVHLSYTSAGEIITSEKGNPRISCYSAEGEFRSLLLNSVELGGGNTAYNVKIHRDKLFVAGKNMISTFRYNREAAAQTACAGCDVDCPLREGNII